MKEIDEQKIQELIHKYEIEVYYKELFKRESEYLFNECNKLMKENELLTRMLDEKGGINLDSRKESTK